MEPIFRVAILDMNNNHPNQGMRGIKEILGTFSGLFEYQVFDVRGKGELPDLSYDAYISSGGPGHPLKPEGDWSYNYYNLLDELWKWNQDATNPRKFAFLICYSFQMACHHFKLGEITKRKSSSFGVYPTHKTKAGRKDPLFSELPDPFYIVDSRDYQLVQPNLKVFQEHGASILSLEKIRTHVEFERAIMAVRLSPEVVGVQFHPEADPMGMRWNFKKKKNREKVIKNYGQRKYDRMMDHLEDPGSIKLTHDIIVPTFLNDCYQKLCQHESIIESQSHHIHGS